MRPLQPCRDCHTNNCSLNICVKMSKKEKKNKKENGATPIAKHVRCKRCLHIARVSEGNCPKCGEELPAPRAERTPAEDLRLIKRVRIDYEVQGVSKVIGLFSIEDDADFLSLSISNAEAKIGIGFKDNVPGLNFSVNLQHGINVGQGNLNIHLY